MKQKLHKGETVKVNGIPLELLADVDVESATDFRKVIAGEDADSLDDEFDDFDEDDPLDDEFDDEDDDF